MENNKQNKKTEQKKKEDKDEVSEEERDDAKTATEKKLERLKSEVEAARAEAETARDRMLRTVADYENYKKRLEKEKREFVKYANEKFIKDLLPSLDDLERAIDSSNEGDLESFREGVKIIYKQLNNILKKHNVTPIEATGVKFDPNLHEALMHIPSEEPKNTIVQEYQKGYKLHERVIRPSKVVVSAGSSSKASEE